MARNCASSVQYIAITVSSQPGGLAEVMECFCNHLIKRLIYFQQFSTISAQLFIRGARKVIYKVIYIVPHFSGRKEQVIPEGLKRSDFGVHFHIAIDYATVEHLGSLA